MVRRSAPPLCARTAWHRATVAGWLALASRVAAPPTLRNPHWTWTPASDKPASAASAGIRAVGFRHSAGSWVEALDGRQAGAEVYQLPASGRSEPISRFWVKTPE